MNIDDIWAKSGPPPQSLIGHTNDCLRWFPKVLEWKEGLIDSVCRIHSVDRNMVVRKLFLTVLLHDIGKANLHFQNKIRKLPFGKESHPLASIPFVWHFTKDQPLIKTRQGDSFYPELLAVLSHHAKLHRDLYEGYQEAGRKIPYVEESFFYHFFDWSNSEALRLDIPNWIPLVFSSEIIQPVDAHKTLSKPRYDLNQLASDARTANKTRDIFLLFKSVLHHCDWLASANKTHFEYSVNEDLNSMTTRMQVKLAKEERKFAGWKNFQSRMGAIEGHIFVQIPTGQGKTEGSLLWAILQTKPQKIIYLLPTMVTTNKMWDRLVGFFGKEACGLAHSTARYVISESNDHEETQELREHDLFDKTFFRPVTTATVDQLIYSFFNWGYWVLTGAAAMNARVVIDEVHCYDGFTLGLLLKTIECIRPYETRFAIMSASFPLILQKKLEFALGGEPFEMISDPIFDDKQRHVLQVSNESIDFYFDQILSDFESNQQVLIVCNTITEARRVFEEYRESIPQESKMLYHSQFIFKDKQDKEESLDGLRKMKGQGFLAVCTQICEVSLDLDFDTLYSENAPIDALIQRLGRVNRKGEMQDENGQTIHAKVFISRETELARKKIYTDKLLDATRERLSFYVNQLQGNLKEKDFKKLVDEVYTPENMSGEFEKDLTDGKDLITTLWQHTTKSCFTLSMSEAILEKVSSRKITLIQVECLLQCHNQVKDFVGMLERHEYAELRKYMIKVPLWLAKKNLLKNFKNEALTKRDLLLLDIQYDNVFGIQTPEKNDLAFP